MCNTQYRGRDSFGFDFCPSFHLLSPGEKNQKRPKMTMMKKTRMRPLSWGCCGWTGRTPKGVTGMIVLGFLFCFFLVVVKMMNDDDAQFMYLVQWLRVVICDTARLRLSNKWSQKAFWAKSHGFQWWLFLGFRFWKIILSIMTMGLKISKTLTFIVSCRCCCHTFWLQARHSKQLGWLFWFPWWIGTSTTEPGDCNDVMMMVKI